MTLSEILAALTEIQVDRIISIGETILTLMAKAGAVIAPIIAGILLHRQKRNNDKREENAKITHEKLDANTDMTATTSEKLDKMAVLRGMVTSGVIPSEGNMVEFNLELPGYAYEKFTLAEGAPVLWKSEEVTQGKACRFAVAGPASMGFHAHDVTEKLYVVTGVLEITTDKGTTHIGPGQEFISPPDQIHAVGFCGFGEVVATWPEQVTNDLKIRIYT